MTLLIRCGSANSARNKRMSFRVSTFPQAELKSAEVFVHQCFGTISLGLLPRISGVAPPRPRLPPRES